MVQFFFFARIQPKVSHPDSGTTTSRARSTSVAQYCPLWAPLHYRSTILSALGPDYTLTVLFLGTHTRTSQWVTTHHGSALARYSLNFGVPMEPEASELPKGLTLFGGGYVHIRHRRSTPLGNVGSYIRPLTYE